MLKTTQMLEVNIILTVILTESDLRSWERDVDSRLSLSSCLTNVEDDSNDPLRTLALSTFTCSIIEHQLQYTHFGPFSTYSLLMSPRYTCNLFFLKENKILLFSHWLCKEKTEPLSCFWNRSVMVAGILQGSKNWN